MYTHCPNCNTHFEITQEYLDIAHGKVQCGKCAHVFNALETLYNNDSSEQIDEPSEAVQDIPETDKISTNNQPENEVVSIPNINIKEKMERIVASLTAATAELKNARETTTFHKTTIEEQKKPPQAAETASADKSLLEDELLQIENTLLADELFQNKEALKIEDTTPDQDALEVKETLPDQDALEVKETLPDQDALEVKETLPDQDALEVKETLPDQDALEVKETLPDEDALEVKETLPDEDELELVNFSEDEFNQTNLLSPTDFNAHKVDQDDIDIFNSLIDSPLQAVSDNELRDEIDDINKTLSDEVHSLDDELSSLDDEFEQLDNGDDLLAELEQLENDFLNNTAATESLDSDKAQPQADSPDDLNKANSGFEEKADTELDSDDKVSTSSHIQEDAVPSFLTQNDSAGSSPSTIFSWLAASVVFLVVLAFQHLHFNSIEFSQDPEIRPLLESLCPLTGCSLPLIKTPNKIVTVTHDVRTHPTVNNALEIQLTFKNKAAYTQSYPILEITFSNPVGEIIARRKFSPHEYMKKENYYTSGIKSNKSQEINLNVVDPDPGSLLSFQFNYL